jgi:hypothetical protein
MNIGFLCFYQLRSFMTVLEGQFISIDFLSKDNICQIWDNKLKGNKTQQHVQLKPTVYLVGYVQNIIM